MSLKKRLPTALVLLSLLFVIVQFTPPIFFFILLLVFVSGSLLEFYGLASKKAFLPQKGLGLGLAFLVCATFYFRAFRLEHALVVGILIAAFYFVFAFRTLQRLPHFPASFAVTLAGVLYIGFPLSFLYSIRVDYGPLYLYFLFAVIFLGDTGAYFIGSPFGRHKMTPVASPNKTWEGSAGGIVFAAAGAAAAQLLLLREIPIGQAILCGVITHAVAQVSDPLESLFKRAAGVKDSSNIFPGHGGFLDRIDSLILAGPVFYFIVKYFWR